MRQKKLVYYGKKCLIFLISVFILSVAVFYVARLAPGDPLISYYGDRTEKMSPEEREWAMEKLGLNEPISVQYVKWVKNAFHGEFGISFKYKQDVLEVIGDNYKYLKETLETELPGVVVCSMEGTYLPMIDLRAWVKPEETHDFIQGKCRLAVDYGEWFGVGYEGFIRMNLATDPVFVKQAAETIIREAKKLKEK